MAQWIKVLTAKTDKFNAIPWNHMMEGKHKLLQNNRNL